MSRWMCSKSASRALARARKPKSTKLIMSAGESFRKPRAFFQRSEGSPPGSIWKGDPSLRLKGGSAQNDADPVTAATHCRTAFFEVPSRPRPVLLHDDGDFSVLLYDLDSDRAAVSFHEKADAVVFDAQIADRKLRDALRQVRTIEDHAPIAGIDGDAKARLQDHEHRACCPGLRRAGNRIERRALTLAAIDSADEFR